MSEAAIQTAIFETLKGDAPLASLLAEPGVFDYVPQADKSEADSVFPYVTIGDDTHVDWDTDDLDGLESSVTVHQWSRHKGRIEVKRIQAAVRKALQNVKIPIEGMNTVLLQFESSSVVRDPDGETYHGVQTFRLLAHEVDL